MNRNFSQFRAPKERSHSYHSKHYSSNPGRSTSINRHHKEDSYHGPYSSNFHRVKDRSLCAGQNLRPPKWDFTRLTPIKKVLYNEHPLVVSRDELMVEEQRKDLKILIQGHTLVKPIMSFEESNFPASFLTTLSSQFSGPTPIQCQAWPLALSGFDLIGIARTGSGKTLAYLLPGLLHIQAQTPIVNHKPIFLVLTPTRELALQVQHVCLEYSALIQLRSTCIYGGSSKSNQIRELERGCDVVVATPGRLLDLLEMRKIFLDAVSFCVLDEADRMLDMGFEPQIRKILEQLRPDKQTLMWSATWPKDVKKLAEDFLKDYVQIYVGSIELSANQNILQNIDFCEESEKSSKLLELLNRLMRDKNCKTIIFCETKRKVKSITIWLQRMGYYVDCIHGDKEQYSRESVLSAFRQGKIVILVATDVASRGLDIEGIRNIINMDFPNVAEDYIHRIGRTARADNSGFAYTFFTPQNYKHCSELLRILRESHQEIPPRLNEINHDYRSFSRKRGREFEHPTNKFPRYSQEARISKPYNGSKNSLTFKQPSYFSERGASYNSHGSCPSLQTHIADSFQSLSNASIQLPNTGSFHIPSNSPLQLSSNTSIQIPVEESVRQVSEWNVKMKLNSPFIPPPVYLNNPHPSLQNPLPAIPASYSIDNTNLSSQYDAITNTISHQYL
ncbi:DDX5 protein [Oopsacas minuta]|uniref:RNA helicase n=1 Tax=Oopsacas minuta TaxID=111878 RepID=A0AAV7K4I6_9METZ|nr:DDX5 protein [Oopsacas minuta]